MSIKRPSVRSWCRGDFEVSTDPGRLDAGFIWRELSRSYWSKGRTRKEIRKAFDNSLVVFGLYRRDGAQVGCARLVTDTVRLAFLMDVIVTEAERGKGLGTWLARCVVDHPDLRAVRTWMLATRDAHSLYKKSGWKPLSRCEKYMVRRGGVS
ncbi:MAG: GNAT family N-acetyltransferase [Elusimicrobia bacterium]|nr:GNAT family N-acetyltransferase [Elusimicrobiota bacterium]